MKEFEVYFEIFSKKMKTVVKAYNSEDAALIVKKNLVIFKAIEVVEKPEKEAYKEHDPLEDPVDMLKRIFGMS